MESHFEFRYHAKISAAAAQGPEQIGILASACAHDRSIGSDQREPF